jgi:pilus assembly protein Flp/PilA
MTKFMRLISRHGVRNEQGAAIIEYALIAGLISVIAIAAITTVGEDVRTRFQAVASAL